MQAVLIAFLAVVIVLTILSILGYIFNWDWIGLGPYVSPPHSKDSDFQRGKTLWDWLQLVGVLAVPVVVGFGAVWFTTRQGKVAVAENKNNQRKTALQAYRYGHTTTIGAYWVNHQYISLVNIGAFTFPHQHFQEWVNV